jgi:hypothetical protein
MFKLDLSPSYWWPVKFRLPTAAGSQMETRSFDAEFKRLELGALEDLSKRSQAQSLSDAAIATELVIGWKGVADAQGRELPFTAGNFAQVLAVPGVAGAVCAAFFGSQPRAAEKN